MGVPARVFPSQHRPTRTRRAAVREPRLETTTRPHALTIWRMSRAAVSSTARSSDPWFSRTDQIFGAGQAPRVYGETPTVSRAGPKVFGTGQAPRGRFCCWARGPYGVLAQVMLCFDRMGYFSPGFWFLLLNLRRRLEWTVAGRIFFFFVFIFVLN